MSLVEELNSKDSSIYRYYQQLAEEYPKYWNDRTPSLWVKWSWTLDPLRWFKLFSWVNSRNALAAAAADYENHWQHKWFPNIDHHFCSKTRIFQWFWWEA